MTTPAPPLSPAAQDVSDAAYNAWITEDHASSIAAAALIAAADQVVPVDRGSRRQCNIRRELLALAAELRQEGRA